MAISFAIIMILGTIPFIIIFSIASWLLYENHNIATGIIISALIPSIGLLIYPGMFVVWYGDIYYTIGILIGLVLTFKKLKPDQLFIKTGIIIGISGGFISSFSISTFFWVIYIYDFNLDIITLGFNLLNFIPFAVIYGIIIGYLFGSYKRRQVESERESNLF
jgi:hypothetical protein